MGISFVFCCDTFQHSSLLLPRRIDLHLVFWLVNIRMSTKSQAKEKAAPNDSGEDDDDVAALIYRESQLRKAEAAAAAAERKKTSSASTHHRTSTRKRTSVKSQSKESLPSLLCKGASNKRGESLRRRMIGPEKRWPKRSTDMNALLMNAQI